MEIPAGKLDKGEDPDECVRRELEEETGFVASKVRRLVSYWPTAAFSQEVIHLYVAEGLRPTKMNPDDDEYLELIKVSPRQLEQWISPFWEDIRGLQDFDCLSHLESRLKLHQTYSHRDLWELSGEPTLN